MELSLNGERPDLEQPPLDNLTKPSVKPTFALLMQTLMRAENVYLYADLCNLPQEASFEIIYSTWVEMKSLPNQPTLSRERVVMRARPFLTSNIPGQKVAGKGKITEKIRRYAETLQIKSTLNPAA